MGGILAMAIVLSGWSTPVDPDPPRWWGASLGVVATLLLLTAALMADTRRRTGSHLALALCILLVSWTIVSAVARLVAGYRPTAIRDSVSILFSGLFAAVPLAAAAFLGWKIVRRREEPT